MISLRRFAYFDDRTVGRLNYGGQQVWTIERPWKGNQPFESCIPDGEYRMARVDSPKFGPGTWEVADVPGRTHILIHVANTAADVVGCIGLGMGLHPNLGGVGPSGAAIKAFHDATEGLTEETLVITSGEIR